MESPAYKYHWSKPEQDKDFEIIECPAYDTIKDFRRDPTGVYVLIKINLEILRLEVGVCSKENKILKVFRGYKSQDLYHTILTYEKKHNLRWFEEKAHLVYLGKELKKAELALVLGQTSYFQE